MSRRVADWTLSEVSEVFSRFLQPFIGTFPASLDFGELIQGDVRGMKHYLNTAKLLIQHFMLKCLSSYYRKNKTAYVEINHMVVPFNQD